MQHGILPGLALCGEGLTLALAGEGLTLPLAGEGLTLPLAGEGLGPPLLLAKQEAARCGKSLLMRYLAVDHEVVGVHRRF